MTSEHVKQSEGREERWYRFEQQEVMSRAFWVRAPSLKVARQLVRAFPGGSGIGVPDYAPNNPDSIRIKGPGRLEGDQDLAQGRADELEVQGGW